jgi:hypothetical protein
MKANDAKQLKELERENAQLKRIVADQVLEEKALKDREGELVGPACRRRRPRCCATDSASASAEHAEWAARIARRSDASRARGR